MTNPSFDLTGKVALVTGASRGIGEAIARAYAGAGAAVVITARKAEDLDAVAADIRAGGGQALAVAAHSGDPAAVTAAVAATVEAFGGLDILVNNAATNPHFGPMLTADDAMWDKTLDINVKGYVRWIRAAVPAMRARGGGKVINLSSILGRQAAHGMGVYCVTKAAVLMLTEVLAMELAPLNIQVNAMAPGFVKTRFSSALWDDPKRAAALAGRVPQNRIAEPEELTGIALYLAAPASSFTTGATFTIDGGHIAGALAIPGITEMVTAMVGKS
jgi:NAD(P)-dependent dehydrogenase (short-subunit alcohol dehydrogenase family)